MKFRRTVQIMFRLLIATRIGLIITGVIVSLGFTKLAGYTLIATLGPFLWATCILFVSYSFDYLEVYDPLDERLIEPRFPKYFLLTTWVPLFFIAPPIHSELSNVGLILLVCTLIILTLATILESLNFSKFMDYFTGET